MLDDTRLRIFLSAAETGNFTQTAKLFHITQPAVSQNISDLEKSYNIRLFDRLPGALSLTPEGIVFKNFAEGITGSYDELEFIFKNFRDLDLTREVSIATDAATLPWVSGVLLPYIYKVCPSARVAVCLTGTNDYVDMQVTTEGGVRNLVPSASFSISALYRLLKLL